MPDAPRDGFRFDDVSLRADDGSPILDHVSVVVACEGITVVAGPSGAGKSTLLRLCNRLEVPSDGCITLDGADLAGVDPLALRRRAGMVFQRAVVFAGTVRDNLRVARADVDDGLAVATLERVGLDASFLDHQADDLSGGEAQRMCIARTLLTEPEILLMDEPTSALDPDNRTIIEQLARRFADGGTPIVWVTHDLDQAARLADRTVVLVDGHVADDEEARHFLGKDRA